MATEARQALGFALIVGAVLAAWPGDAAAQRRQPVPQWQPGGTPAAPYGHPSYGRSDFAYRSGYEDGYLKGLEDGRKQRWFDVYRHRWYRSGDRHYERWHGPRDYYRQAYRSGFFVGYERGFAARYPNGYRQPYYGRPYSDPRSGRPIWRFEFGIGWTR